MPRRLVRQRPTSIAAISVAVLALAATGRAHAQSADAEALFNDGDRLMKQHKLAEACDAFESSNRIEARAGTLIRLGECREANHQLASAWSAYKDALRRVKDPRKRHIAEAKVAELEPELSQLKIVVRDDARVEGLDVARNGKPVDPGEWNRAIPIDGGTYEIAATAPGHQRWQKSVDVPEKHGNVSLYVPPLAADAAPVTEAPEPVAQPDTPAHPHPHDEATSTFTSKRVAAVVVLGVGVGAAVAGGLLGRSANSTRDEAYGLCPSPTVPCTDASHASSLVATAHDRAYEADAAFGVAAAAAIAASVLWLTGRPEHVTVSPDVAARGGSIEIVGHF
jgi:hypothetical protein